MARLQPEFRPVDELSEADINAIIDIAREQVALMDRLKDALANGDTLAALDAARDLVGLEKEARQQ